MRLHKKLWIGLFIMSLLTPLGLIIPKIFNAGGAWGEWGAEELARYTGYMPQGLKRLAGLWNAPFPDYNAGSDSASIFSKGVSYMISGLIGIFLAAIIIYIISRLIIKHER